MALMSVIDKYIMSSIKMKELEDLILDNEKQVVRLSVKRNLVSNQKGYEAVRNLDETISDYEKNKKDAYKELIRESDVQDRNKRTYINMANTMSNEELLELIQSMQEMFAINENRKEELTRRRNAAIIKTTEAKLARNDEEAKKYSELSVACHIESRRLDDMQMYYVDVISTLNQILNKSNKLVMTK